MKGVAPINLVTSHKEAKRVFMGNFKYPDGTVIDQAKRQLTDLAAEIPAIEVSWSALLFLS